MFKIRLLKLFLLLSIFVCSSTIVLAGIPEVSNVIVTDVTTSSFSVIWTASEASTANLEVYEDDLGTVPIFDGVITPHPIESGDLTIKTLAEDNGVMKVRVTGLLPETSYYFKTITTSKSTSETTRLPDLDPPLAVTTETLTVRTLGGVDGNVPFSNDLIVQECYLDDGVTPANGTLLVATFSDGHYPLSSFVGDGATSPYAVIDLNNAFDSSTLETSQLSSGVGISFFNFRGINGVSQVNNFIPPNSSATEIKLPDAGMVSGWNLISTQITPGNSSLLDVLNPIIDKIDVVWAYNATTGQWLRYDKSLPSFLNDLTNIQSSTGYWVLLNDYASLTVNGTLNSGIISLKEGWNLVGSNEIESQPLSSFVAPLIDSLEVVWCYDAADGGWKRFDKNLPSFLNDLETVEPGKGYWFLMNSDAEIQVN
jgi:hypothetical protein